MKFAGFDAARRERQAAPLRLRLFGEEWALPAMPTAAAALTINRWSADHEGDDEVPVSSLSELVDDLIPAEMLTDWRARGITHPQLAKVSSWAMEQYQARTRERGDGDAAGEARAPIGAAGSSCGTGTCSRRTSLVSTGSTFRRRFAR